MVVSLRYVQLYVLQQTMLHISESINARGGFSLVEGVHSRMGEVFHTMRLSSQTVRPARDGTRREGAQHYAEENTGRREHRQKGKGDINVMPL